MRENKTFLLELKESLLIMRDKPSSNKNMTSAPLYLFDRYKAYGNFSILTRNNKIFLLELKESLLIMMDQLSLNRNITSAQLHLFDRP